jgi:hypothetical protein
MGFTKEADSVNDPHQRIPMKPLPLRQGHILTLGVRSIRMPALFPQFAECLLLILPRPAVSYGIIRVIREQVPDPVVKFEPCQLSHLILPQRYCFASHDFISTILGWSNILVREASMGKLTRIFAWIIVCGIGTAQQNFNGCPPEGDARSLAVKALDRLKNRDTAPTPDQINNAVTLAALLQPGDDRGRWKVRDGAEIVGYVWDVKPGGIESCNCHATDVDKRDTHIELVLDPMAGNAETNRFIVEVTPRWRAMLKAQGIDWRTRALSDHFKGRWVKVQGWLLLDAEHLGEAENTAPGRFGNWRATAWEVHPVTKIEVVQRPR